MDERTARDQVVEAGRQLLAAGLVARTWGNISCRLDEEHFLITPSGLSYMETGPEDLAVVSLSTGEWTGPRKPSSEKGIHSAAYHLFPDAGFVIHTHQTYASAMAVHCPEELTLTPEEEEKLGGLGIAEYGLPGTGTLKKAVKTVMECGVHTVLMANHGALIVGTDRQDAFEKAMLLEDICRRGCLESIVPTDEVRMKKRAARLEALLQEEYPGLRCVTELPVLARTVVEIPISAQLDDMAQMMGAEVPVIPCRRRSIRYALKHHCAVLVAGVGGVVYGKTPEDTEALAMLLTKAAVAAEHTRLCDVDVKLSFVDTELMHLVYQKKYSRKMHGK